MTTESAFFDYAARLRQFMARARTDWDTGKERDAFEPQFNLLALELFALQFAHNDSYRRFCVAHDVTPSAVEHWAGIPTVPTSAFKEFELTCLCPAERSAVFHSSGTTGQQFSRHFHSAASIELYEASLLSWFEAHLFAGSSSGDRRTQPGAKTDFLALTPCPTDAPHSSLAHMFGVVAREFGSANSVFGGRVGPDGAWDLDWLRIQARLDASVQSNQPLWLFGTAFNFVHLIDQLAGRAISCSLPAGSRVLETGGYKGRSRSMPRAALHDLMVRHLGVPNENIRCEYGMSELSSQAYDGVIAGPAGARCGHRTFQFPPWARARVVSPETGREVGDGETGLIQVFDLANAWSVLAIQTEDIGVRRGGGFELLGRMKTAEPRGCSLMAV
jgi:hypothetical protein